MKLHYILDVTVEVDGDESEAEESLTRNVSNLPGVTDVDVMDVQ